MQEYGLIANQLDPNKSFDAIFSNYPKRCDANLIDAMKISSIIPNRCDDNIKDAGCFPSFGNCLFRGHVQ